MSKILHYTNVETTGKEYDLQLFTPKMQIFQYSTSMTASSQLQKDSVNVDYRPTVTVNRIQLKTTETNQKSTKKQGILYQAP